MNTQRKQQQELLQKKVKSHKKRNEPLSIHSPQAKSITLSILEIIDKSKEPVDRDVIWNEVMPYELRYDLKLFEDCLKALIDDFHIEKTEKILTKEGKKVVQQFIYLHPIRREKIKSSRGFKPIPSWCV